MAKVKIVFEKSEPEIIAELNSTKTAKAVLNALPINSKAERWGDEIYFYIDVKIEKEKDARQEVEIGDIAYWPEGAICLFFGKTPVSKSEKPRAYSPVNVFGSFDKKYVEILKKIKGGKVGVEKA